MAIIACFIASFIVKQQAELMENDIPWDSDDTFVVTQWIAGLSQVRSYLHAFICLLLCFNLLYAIKMFSGAAIALLILRAMLRKVLSYGLILLVITAAFSIFEFIISGFVSTRMHSLLSTWLITLQSGINGIDFRDAYADYPAEDFSHYIMLAFLACFYFFVILVFYQMFVAIIISGFEEEASNAAASWAYEQACMILSRDVLYKPTALGRFWTREDKDSWVPTRGAMSPVANTPSRLSKDQESDDGGGGEQTEQQPAGKDSKSDFGEMLDALAVSVLSVASSESPELEEEDANDDVLQEEGKCIDEEEAT